MNSLLKIGLIGGAAYFLFGHQLAAMFPQLGIPAPTGGPAPAPTPAPAPAPVSTLPVGTTTASAATTKDLLQKWANANDFYHQQGGLLNGWQWGFGYQVVRGTPPPGPDQMFPGQDPARLMTLDEWWTGATKSGLSGIPRGYSPARAWRH